MATQGERRALMFLAAVALLGAGTRAWRAKRVSVDTTGLDRQIEAVDSARPGRAKRSTRSPQSVVRNPQSALRQPVDLDTASPDQIEKLPGIGPALAKRIVADREANGPFGCLAALDRVKGIGPAMLARLDSAVVFSRSGGALCSGTESLTTNH
jgi:competence ComEA-like helix-hairpin-helix protein